MSIKRRPPSEQSRSLGIVLAALLMGVAGCGESESVRITGGVQLDGRPTSAELLFEPLNQKGKREGQSVTTMASEDGRFAISLPHDVGDATDPLPCRISIRISRGTHGTSSAFDYEALPDKVVELRRDVSTDQELILLITQ